MLKLKYCCLGNNTNYIYWREDKTCLEHFNLRKDRDPKNTDSEKECQPRMAVRY